MSKRDIERKFDLIGSGGLVAGDAASLELGEERAILHDAGNLLLDSMKDAGSARRG